MADSNHKFFYGVMWKISGQYIIVYSVRDSRYVAAKEILTNFMIWVS